MKSELRTRFGIDPPRRNLAIMLDGPLLWLRRFSSLLVDEMRPPFRLPWRNRFRGWQLGYTSKSFAMYQLDRNDPGEYLSEFAQKVKTHRINGIFNHLIDDKLGFSLLMEKCGGPCPPVHAIIRRGAIHPLKGTHPSDPAFWLGELLDTREGLVIKPLRGFKGKGFVALHKTEGGYSINGVVASLSDIERLIATIDDCYISDFITQGEYARKIYSRTTNTVRLLTLRDYGTGGPFIAMAVHRIGTKRSYPVDNWKGGLGGMSTRIDLDTGELGRGVSLTSRGDLEWHDRHPETGGRIAGVVVPHWPVLMEKILALAEILSFIPDVAWDCVVTDDGFSILEMNGAPALFVFQVHAPLLRDPRARRFYAYHGVVKQ